MAELVDALVSGASVERRAGSSPVLGTICSVKRTSDLINKVVSKLVADATRRW